MIVCQINTCIIKKKLHLFRCKGQHDHWKCSESSTTTAEQLGGHQSHHAQNQQHHLDKKPDEVFRNASLVAELIRSLLADEQVTAATTSSSLWSLVNHKEVH